VEEKMRIQLVRNATMRIDYAGKALLTDPMLCHVGALFTVAGISPNPVVELPFPAEDAVAGIDCLLVSHDHPDHFERTSTLRLIPRNVPLFCQPGEEESRLREGFGDVVPIVSSHEWGGIRITRRGGRHGKGQVARLTGAASGYVLQAAGEPTLYWTGDSVWCEEVKSTIDEFGPDVIITHSGGGTIRGLGSVIMNGRQTLSALNASPKDAVVVAVHMEAMDHCRVSRDVLRRLARKAGVPDSRLVIPGNGETVVFEN
jgi:L-ascorbate metabolism protein UlaG (beta-lactamase superfamily)